MRKSYTNSRMPLPKDSSNSPEKGLHHRIEFYRDVFVLTPDVDGHVPIMIGPSIAEDKPRIFCSCCRGNYASCAHAAALRNSYEDLTARTGSKSPWAQLRGGRFQTALKPLITRDTRQATAVEAGVERSGRGGTTVTVRDRGGVLLALYESGEHDGYRLAERMGASQGHAGITRAALIGKCSAFVLTDQERLLREKGHRTKRQAEEESLWFRLAYHCFRELKPNASIEVMIDESTGACRLVFHDDTRRLTTFVPNAVVPAVLSSVKKAGGAAPPIDATVEREIFFMVEADAERESLEVNPVIDASQSGDMNKPTSIETRYVYGDLMYIPSDNGFVRLSRASMAILSRGGHERRHFSTLQFAESLEADTDMYSLGKLESDSGDAQALDLFAQEGHDDLARLRGIAVVRRFERLELEPESIEGNDCMLRIAYGAGPVSAPLSAILAAREQKKRYAVTPACIIDCASESLSLLPLAGIENGTRGKISLPRAALLQFRQNDLRIEINGNTKFSQTLTALMNVVPLKPLRAIKTLHTKLRTYQRAGVNWLLFLYENRFGGLLCDDMGLGKTHQAMALMCVARAQRSAKEPFLVVCPTTVISHWQALLERFAPKLSVKVYHGAERRLDMREESADVIVTSYGILRNDIDTLSDHAFAIVFFDEAQSLKNRSTAGWEAARRLVSDVKIAVTGTPVENSITDLKALFDLVLPGYLGTDTHFIDRYLSPIESTGDTLARDRLHRLVGPFILRRTKRNVLKELPEKIEEHRLCSPATGQRKLYEETLGVEASPLVDRLRDKKAKIPYMHVFAVLNRLKRICDHPAIVVDSPESFDKYESGKFELFKEILDECIGSQQKAVVYSQYLDMIDIIERYAVSCGIEAVSLTGATRNRGALIKRFNTDPSCRLFIGSLKAGGRGIDLTAASVVIHYDRWWNAAAEDQATDRVHRFGQQRGVQVFKLITSGTLEERIDRIVAGKRVLAEATIKEDSPDAVKSFSREELLELLLER
ncbi:MAG: hypothetical protein GF344_15555 [Chitinivibrionales bacterium]|nr:hypothetical protein [Chitinivibrionales bacterium]MBD3358116.1 hypothetical protein [Chitinivibrionales bacterium]